jgi:hypothetical protein
MSRYAMRASKACSADAALTSNGEVKRSEESGRISTCRCLDVFVSGEACAMVFEKETRGKGGRG